MTDRPISLRAASADQLEAELRGDDLSPAERAAVKVVFTDRVADDIVASLDLTSHTTPAGWFADPVHRFEMRYWDGRTWTAHVANRGAAEVDPAGAP